MPTINIFWGITRLMSSLMNIFLRWYMFNVIFLQYNVSFKFMLYCVVISLQQCLWNLKFTPQNKDLDGGFGSPKPCIKDSTSPWGNAGMWVVVAVHPLVDFLQKPFQPITMYYISFQDIPFDFNVIIYKKMLLIFVPVFIIFGQNLGGKSDKNRQKSRKIKPV